MSSYSPGLADSCMYPTWSSYLTECEWRGPITPFTVHSHSRAPINVNTATLLLVYAVCSSYDTVCYRRHTQSRSLNVTHSDSHTVTHTPSSNIRRPPNLLLCYLHLFAFLSHHYPGPHAELSLTPP